MTIDTLLIMETTLFCMYFSGSPHKLLVEVQKNIHFLPGIVMLYIQKLSWLYGCHRKREVYQCGDLQKFIDTVTEKVESLPKEMVTEALNGFLEL